MCVNQMNIDNIIDFKILYFSHHQLLLLNTLLYAYKKLKKQLHVFVCKNIDFIKAKL